MKLSYITLLFPIVLVACSKKVDTLHPPTVEVGYVTLKEQPVTLDTTLPGRVSSDQ